MYCNFFGFAEKPFEVTSDPTFLYLTPGCQEVLATLLYGVKERRGFVVLLGEAGTGKTTFLKSLLDQLDEKTKVAFIFTTDVTFEEFLQMVLIELGLKKPGEDVSKVEAFRRLSRYAIYQHSQGGKLVIIIDEAQNLNERAIENLRVLSNFETRKHKLIQIVLAGQPALERKLKHPRLRQLAQRIGLECYLIPFKERETYAYLDHRLAQAEYKGPALFSRKSRGKVWEYSEGIPRKINILCDKALLIAYASKRKRVDEGIVVEAMESLRLNLFKRKGESSQPRSDQKPARWKSFFSKPKIASMGGLGAAACLFFVLVLPFGASFFRNEPEPTRFSSAIDHSDRGYREGTIEFAKPVFSSLEGPSDQERALTGTHNEEKAGQDYQQIDVAEADFSGQKNPHIEPKSISSMESTMTKPDDAWEPGTLASPESIKSKANDISQDIVPHLYQSLKTTKAYAEIIPPEIDDSKDSEVILQIGAYQEKLIALRIVNKFAQEGYDAYLQKKDFKDGRIFYRVRLRCSGDMNKARGIQARFREKGYDKAFIVRGGEV